MGKDALLDLMGCGLLLYDKYKRNICFKRPFWNEPFLLRTNNGYIFSVK